MAREPWDKIRIPTSKLAPVLREYIYKYWPQDDFVGQRVGGVTIFAESCGEKSDTLADIISQRAATVGFNVVDKFFCAMGDPLLYWESEEFIEYYDQLLEGAKCRNGHTWTEENTFTRADGSVRCRLCRNEQSARADKKRREAQRAQHAT